MTDTSNAAAQPMPPLGPEDSPELTGEQLSAVMHHLEVKAVVPDKPVDLLKSALYYASRGWPVFPTRPRGKVPLTTHGFKDATTDPDKIAWWWKREPASNLATPTGPADQGGCGYDVLDVDGVEGIEQMASIPHDELPPTLALAFTPGDPPRGRGPGRHHYVEATGDGNHTKFMKGCDWRGVGGFVVLSPSVGPSGAVYHWITRPGSI